MWNTLLKTLKDNFVLGALIFCVLYLGFLHYNQDNIEKVQVVERVVEKPVIQETVKREVVTEVKVQEKEKVTDPDVVLNTQDSLKVSVNGKEVNLKPKTDEKFDFKEDYVELRQNSSYDLKIDNKPLEPTWGVGVGISTNGKPAGIATVRLKQSPVHVWGMSDGETSAVGVMFSTNYK